MQALVLVSNPLVGFQISLSYHNLQKLKYLPCNFLRPLKYRSFSSVSFGQSRNCSVLFSCLGPGRGLPLTPLLQVLCPFSVVLISMMGNAFFPLTKTDVPRAFRRGEEIGKLFCQLQRDLNYKCGIEWRDPVTSVQRYHWVIKKMFTIKWLNVELSLVALHK